MIWRHGNAGQAGKQGQAQLYDWPSGATEPLAPGVQPKARSARLSGIGAIGPWPLLISAAARAEKCWSIHAGSGVTPGSWATDWTW
jgi:hypothetical protein